MRSRRLIVKLLIILLVVILLLQIVLPEISVVIKNGKILQFMADNEDESKYYINTAQDMWQFAEKVNNGDSFKNIQVYLTEDINLGCSEDNQWVPISNFKGNFDGQGHTISGLYIKADISLMGLFARNDGTIRNLNIVNSYMESVASASSEQRIGFIVAYNYSNSLLSHCNVTTSEIKSESERRVYAGGICGYNSGVIEYCENTSDIYTKTIAAIGGIVGENYDLVRKSKNTGTIIGGDNTTGYNSTGIGGIAGSNHSKISLCTNYGSVKAEDYTGRGFIGGIVGTNFDGYTEIFACSNFGNIEGELCGGIVGRNGSDSNIYTIGGIIKNSYNAGKVNASSKGGAICYSNKVEGKIQNCYYLESDLNGCVYDNAEENTSIIEKTETEMKKSEFIQLLNTEGKQYEYVKNDYPEIDLSSPKVEVKYDATSTDKIIVTLNADESIRDVLGWTTADNAQTLTKTFYLNYNEEIILEDYNYNQTTVEVNIENLTNSLITEENYYINNFEDLQILAQEVNSGNNMENKNIYLMNDIQIPQNYIWDVIGNSGNNLFMGNFYGNNKKIRGININGYSYYKGLFGYIKNAHIEGLEVEGEINGESKYTGGIAAYNYRSYIEKCTNSIIINEKNNPYDNQLDDSLGVRVGGIVGYASNSSRNSIINDCTNNGGIFCIRDFMQSNACGGIAGQVQTTTISYCSNEADIIATGSYYTGGITGKTELDSQIIACYNKGNIAANSIPNGLGGIAGELTGVIMNSYNFGNVEYNGTASINNIGGIVGRTYFSIALKNCYNVGQSETGGIAGVISSTNGEISNNYYLKSSASSGYDSSNIENIEITEIDTEEMKSEDFINLLSKDTNAWRQDNKNINSGYPYLVKLEGIEITRVPEKIDYKEGEDFCKSGMTVTALYNDGSTKDITNYTIIDGNNLKVGTSNVTISYTDNGVTKVVTQSIIVKPAIKITSNKYEISAEQIKKISHKTNLQYFMENIRITNAIEIKMLDKNGNTLNENDFVETGMILVLKSEIETKTLKLVVAGDTTGDGVADFKDIVAINNHRLSKKQLEGEYLMAGEVTGDEKVDFKDIVKINKFRLNKIIELF